MDRGGAEVDEVTTGPVEPAGIVGSIEQARLGAMQGQDGNMDGSEWPTEVSEAEATGEIKEIYQDIKAVLGVEMVNLLYRRLAVEKEALRWAWGTIRTAAIEGELERGAAALILQLKPLCRGAIPIAALRGLGIDAAAQASIAGVVGAFNDANPLNLVGSCMWATMLDGQPTRRPAGAPILNSASRRSNRASLPLPPMIDITEMEPGTAAIVRELLKWRDSSEKPSVPSLYRHLAHWPAFLALSVVILDPVLANGELMHALKALRSSAMTTAQDILSRGAPTTQSLPQGKALSLVREITAAYPTRISELVVIGRTMEAMLGVERQQ